MSKLAVEDLRCLNGEKWVTIISQLRWTTRKKCSDVIEFFAERELSQHGSLGFFGRWILLEHSRSVHCAWKPSSICVYTCRNSGWKASEHVLQLFTQSLNLKERKAAKPGTKRKKSVELNVGKEKIFFFPSLSSCCLVFSFPIELAYEWVLWCVQMRFFVRLGLALSSGWLLGGWLMCVRVKSQRNSSWSWFEWTLDLYTQQP